jgi:hypothetical protein
MNTNELGKEQLQSHQDDDHKVVTIIVNARPLQVDKNKELTYRDVVILAEGDFINNPDVTYTVTYTKDKHDKSHDMVDGGKTIKPKEGMAFNVSKTDKS